VPMALSASVILWAQVPGSWISRANLGQARSGHTATLLTNGEVLVVGGVDGSGHALATAELYDPSTDSYAQLSSTLATAVSGHTATLLNDGTVLIAGGIDDSGKPVADAALFDPSTDTFSALTPMATARSNHTATLLADGRVLIAGGTDGSAALASLEVYDPAGRTFSDAPNSLATARQDHTATLLSNGQVLIAGGSNSSGVLNSAELFNPKDGSVTGAGSLSVARTLASASLLIDGTVLITGGKGADGSDVASAEDYDPAANSFVLLSAQMITARNGHVALTLPHNGRVFISGGTSGGTLASGTEVYDPVSGTFMGVDPAATPRRDFAASFLASPGSLLVSGGLDVNDQTLASSEAFGFPTISSDKPDYPPGDQVVLNGAGWQPNETVLIDIHQDDGDPDTNLTSVADGSGAFTNSSFQVGADVNVKFLVTASGQNSGWTVQTIFTDAGFSSITVGAQSPSSITPGASATFPIAFLVSGSGTATITFNPISGLPAGASGSFSPNSVTCDPTTCDGTATNSTLAVTTTGSVATGSYTFTVSAADNGGVTHTATGTLVVGSASGTPTATLTPTVTATPTATATATATATPSRTATATATPTSTPTRTATPTATKTATPRATASPPPAITIKLPPAPFATLSRRSVTFPATIVGTSSQPKTITVTNNLNVTLNILSITITDATIGREAPLTLGKAGQAGATKRRRKAFKETDDCGKAVSRRHKCTISVTYEPTQTGVDVGTLIVTDSPGNMPNDVQTQRAALTGVAVSPSPPRVSPTKLSFNPQKVGTISAPKSVTVSNASGVTLHLTAVSIKGDFVEDPSTCQAIAPHSKCHIDVRFKPMMSGNRSGLLTITDDSGKNLAHNISLSGRAR
jgi:Galactose oxidase, central domain/Kelch motif